MRKQRRPLWRRAAADVASAWLLKGGEAESDKSQEGTEGCWRPTESVPGADTCCAFKEAPALRRGAAAPLTWVLTQPLLQKRRENANKLFEHFISFQSDTVGRNLPCDAFTHLSRSLAVLKIAATLLPTARMSWRRNVGHVPAAICSTKPEQKSVILTRREKLCTRGGPRY